MNPNHYKAYQKILAEMLNGMEPEKIIGKLMEIGVISITRMKVLAVREYCKCLAYQGIGKVDSMHLAADKFSCSFEYVRKCIYYYTDINLNTESNE